MIPITITLRDRKMSRVMWYVFYRSMRLAFHEVQRVAPAAAFDLLAHGSTMQRLTTQDIRAIYPKAQPETITKLEHVPLADLRMPMDKVCPWCGIKHWERSIACVNCKRGE